MGQDYQYIDIGETRIHVCDGCGSLVSPSAGGITAHNRFHRATGDDTSLPPPSCPSACWACLDAAHLTPLGMVVCERCGHKRCPHATNHLNLCTNSNEPGQPGSRY
jgi:hypothetical protein